MKFWTLAHHSPRSGRSVRGQRSRRRITSSIERLEERQLLSAELLKDINLAAFNPQALLPVGTSRYFTAIEGTSINLYRSQNNGTPSLLKGFPADVSQAGVDLSSAVVIGDRAFFVANDGVHGRETWVLDDSDNQVRLLDDIASGAISSVTTAANSWFTAVGSSTFYFVARLGFDDALYRSDGVTTTKVAAENGLDLLTFGQLVDFNGRLYFTANDGPTGIELYRINDAGKAERVANINLTAGGGGDASSDPQQLTVAGGVLYFTAIRTGSVRELFRLSADGTTVEPLGGTSIKDPKSLIASGDALAFTIDVGNTPRLAISRGTNPTTGIVTLAGLPSGSTLGPILALGSDVLQIYFHPQQGTDLWVHHTTTGTSEKLLDLFGQTTDSTRLEFTTLVTGTRAYFAAVDPASGALRLGATNGTPTGTANLGAIQPGASATQLGQFGLWAGVNGTLYFANRDTQGTELWRSSGTVATTVRVRDIYPGATSSLPRHLVAEGNGIAFVAASDTGANQIWTSEGTSATTILRTTLTQGGAPSAQTASALTGVDDDSVRWISLALDATSVVFFADDGIHGREPWITDGTNQGTRLLRDLNPAGSSTPLWLANLGGASFLFTRRGPLDADLWRINGGANPVAELVGTVPLVQERGEPVELGGIIYFAIEAPDGYKLLRTSGQAGSGLQTVRTFERGKGLAQSLSQLAIADNKLHFLTDDSATNRRILWSSDGTEAGTVELQRFARVTTAQTEIAALGNTLLFTARPVADDGKGFELWSYTAAGGALLHTDINPNAAHSVPADFHVIGSTLYFTASTASGSRELLRAGAAPGSASVVADAQSGARASFLLLNAAVARGKLHFVAYDAAGGDELWIADPATNSLQKADINPGAGSSLSYTDTRFLVVGDALLFNADNGSAGSELWISDAAGTRLFSDVIPGPSGSAPEALGVVAGGVIMAANDPVAGRELIVFRTTGSNTPPTLDPITNRVINEGQQLSIPLIATAPEAGQTVTLSLVNGAIHGAAIIGNNFVWTPTEAQGDGSTYDFTIRATDTGFPPAFIERSFRVTVNEVNQTPVLAFIPDATITAGQTAGFTATATDSDLPVQLITYSLIGAPANATINPTTGAFSWPTASTQAAGSFSFTVRAKDSFDAVVDQVVKITVLAGNRPPSLGQQGNLNREVNQPLAIAFASLASDPDAGQSLTYSIISAPVLGSQPTINPQSGLFQWTPTTTQSATLTIRVTDNGSPALSSGMTFQVQVVPAPVVLTGGALNRVRRAYPTIKIRFSGALTPATAQSLRNYRLVLPGRDRRLGTRDDVVQRIRRVAYNPADNTVTLTPARAFSKRSTYRLTLSNLIDEFGRSVSGQLLIQRAVVRIG